MTSLYFLSDAHFGAQSKQEEEKKYLYFVSFLDKIKSENAALIINGDLFDFWFEYKYVIPSKNFHILAKLSELINSGIEIRYIAGNHDFWINHFMVKILGMPLYPDDLELNVFGKSVYIRHGDGLLKKDYLYRFLKRILRNKLNIFLYRLLHPDIGIPLALAFSKLSRDSKQNDENYSDMDYREFARKLIEEKYDIVVLGHTHYPALEPYKNGWYLNPGNWMHHFSYAVIDENGPHLYRWDGEKGTIFEPDLPPGNLK